MWQVWVEPLTLNTCHKCCKLSGKSKWHKQKRNCFKLNIKKLNNIYTTQTKSKDVAGEPETEMAWDSYKHVSG